jgi:hypothetical protein
MFSLTKQNQKALYHSIFFETFYILFMVLKYNVPHFIISIYYIFTRDCSIFFYNQPFQLITTTETVKYAHFHIEISYESTLTSEYLSKKALSGTSRLFLCVPSMGNNLVVKVHYGLGSRNR